MHLNTELLIASSAIPVLSIPYTLSHMHRYFYMADVLAVQYAFRLKKHGYVHVVVGVTSLLRYMPCFIGRAYIMPIGLPLFSAAMLAVIGFVLHETILIVINGQ